MSEQNSQLTSLAERYLARHLTRGQFLREAAAIGVSATVAGTFLEACSSSPAKSKPHVSRTLRYGPAPDWLNYDTPTNPADYPLPPYNMIFEGLTTFKPGTWQIVNLLADTIEPSSDGTSYNFVLKKGITFQGGYGEMTAADVKFSFERAAGIQKLYANAGKSNTTTSGPDWTGLDEVKVTGKYSGQVIFKKPFVPFTTLTLPWNTSSWIVPQKAVEKLGKSFSTKPVGTGPYELTSYTRNTEMVLNYFKDYAGAAKAIIPSYDFDEVRFSLTSQTATPTGEALTVPLRAGAVDFTPYLSALDVKQLAGSPNISVYSFPQNIDYNLIFVNVQNPKLKDIRVRQALRYAIDIPAIITVANEKQNSRAYSVIAPGILGNWAGAPHYQRDVGKAKALLHQAGVSSLDLTLAITAASSELSTTIGELIQSNFKDAGIKLTINTNPPNNYTTDPNIGELYYTEYGGAPDPYYQLEWYTCSQVKTWNWSFWCNQQYSRMFAELTTVSDPTKRAQLAVKMQQLMDQSAGFIWVYYGVAHYASRSNIKPAFTAAGYPDLRLFKAV